MYQPAIRVGQLRSGGRGLGSGGGGGSLGVPLGVPLAPAHPSAITASRPASAHRVGLNAWWWSGVPVGGRRTKPERQRLRRRRRMASTRPPARTERDQTRGSPDVDG